MTQSGPGVHVNANLSTFIAGYTNGNFIADDVCPIILADKKSDLYQKYRRQDVSQIEDDLIGPKSEASEVDYEIGSGTFICKDRGRKATVARSTQGNADAPHDPLEYGARLAMNKILLGREKRVADIMMTAANYATGNTAAAGTVWSDETNGTPLTNLHTAIAAIAPSMQEETELIAVCALEVWQALSKHPDFRGGGSVGSVITPEQFNGMLGIDRLFVSNTQYTTNNKGQTPTFARVWDSTAFALVRVPTTEVTDEKGLFCATFRENLPGLPAGIAVRNWEEPSKGRGGSDVVQVELADDEVTVQDDMGYLITSVLA